MVRVAVDAMGGDFAPESNLEGAAQAVRESPEVSVICIGTEAARDMIPPDMKGNDRFQFREVTQVIETAESPVSAIKEKKDSSLVVGYEMLKNGEADAFVSAGNSGAVLAGGQLIAGPIEGIKRTPLAAFIPTKSSFCLLLDCGANMDPKPEYLLQFAIMGSIYTKMASNIENPRVGLVNVGEEEEKGSKLTKAAYELLKECKDINFIGNIEARDIPAGKADVVVCDAFTGNVILKLYEGTFHAVNDILKEVLLASPKNQIGAALIKKDLKERMKSLSASSYGGAPLLGLGGLALKAHGNSTKIEIRNAVLECERISKLDVSGKMREMFNGV